MPKKKKEKEIEAPQIEKDIKDVKPTKESKFVTVKFKDLANETRVTYFGTFKIDNKGIAKDIDKRNLEIFDNLNIKYEIIG